jgi:pyruvate dehydrogenase E2 component (dihydrolipoamide acetyltransferase)
MTEGTIAKWLKQPGDEVKKGEILLEIETDKATMELEAYESGVVEKVLVNEGQTVPIGQPIMLIGDGSGHSDESSAPASDDSATAEAAPAPADGAKAEAAPAPAASGEGSQPTDAVEAPGGDAPADETPKQDQEKPAEPQRSYGYGHPTAETALAPGGAAPAQAAPQQAAPAAEATGEVKASPMARAVARELGVNLASVQGSGPGGRVIRSDVEQAAKGDAQAGQPAAASSGQAAQPAAGGQSAPSQQPSAASAASAGAAASGAAPAPARASQAGPEQEIEEVPLSNIRRITGTRMVESLQSAPHFFLTALIDVTDLLALRAQINGQLSEGDRKISVNDLIVKACALTLRAIPEVNVSFGGDKILKKKRIHVGIAVPTERGLTVPVIRDTDQKSVGQIARESHALIEKARAGKLAPADFSGGTFSVSNLGMFGIEHFTAVINTPEAAILAVGAAMKEPTVINGEVVIRDRMRVTLSVDHRALDGADGARYLQSLKQLLESPLRLLVQ